MGLERGYCLMIGGPEIAVKHLDPIFNNNCSGAGDITRTPEEKSSMLLLNRAYLHCGPSGAGHLCKKWFNNGIEYGIMQCLCRRF